MKSGTSQEFNLNNTTSHALRDDGKDLSPQTGNLNNSQTSKAIPQLNLLKVQKYQEKQQVNKEI